MDAAKYAAAAKVVVDLADLDPDLSGSTRSKKQGARLNGALLVWEALTGLTGDDAMTAARLATATHEALRRLDSPEYAMVYRCKRDDDFPDSMSSCDWSTQNYSEIDAHEDQIEPGHFVVGQRERINP